MTKRYYRSAASIENEAEFRSLLAREFPGVDPENLDEPSRRRFLQLLGASAALAAAAGCRWEDEKIAVENERAANRVPGVPQHFATMMELGGVAAPLLLTTFEGRPVKVEGNPDHPMSNGATTSWAQASILSMYDPDRVGGVIDRTGEEEVETTVEAFATANREAFMTLRRTRGEGLRILAGTTSSPTVEDMRTRLLSAMPSAKWVEWEPISGDHAREGSRVAFGEEYRPHYHVDKADVIVCLDDDLLGGGAAALKWSRDFSSRRDPDAGKMNRLYAIESNFSTTGAAADHRLPLRSGLIGAVLAALKAEIGVEGAMGASTILSNERIAKFVKALAADLKAHRGTSLVTVGPHQPAAVHAHVHRLNQWLGNAGKTVEYLRVPGPSRPSHVDGMRALVDDMNAGRVKTLLVLGGNPVYDAPADLDFAAAYAKVARTIHVGLYDDETGKASTWHVPMAHPFETWSDARAADGSWVVGQPTIAPLHGGKSAIEILATVTVDELTDGYDLIRRTFDEKVSTDEQTWRKCIHDGVLADSATAPETPSVKGSLPAMPAASGFATDAVENGQLELNFVPDARVYDGRFANNGWLQELPDFMTKATWDNMALLSPHDAAELDVETGDVVTLEVDGRSLDIAAYVMPGHAIGAVTVPLGYGRTAAGVIGGSTADGVDPVGFDTYKLRTSAAPHFRSGLTVTKTRRTHRLAMVQDHHMIDTVGQEGIEERLDQLVREADVETYRQNPDFVRDHDHGPPLKSLWEPHPYEGSRWGMSIDLTNCTGCNACVVACQAENNIPIVGKERVLEGREMHWLRIDRYFSGDVADPAVVSQPLPCQQCENAPCEQVCPVGATQHSEEGLNDMVYNRCVGTRYCSNNCPYKVRRFNFFNYHLTLGDAENEVLKMVFNPEVTIRARGVMEKCTFCVQRIAAARNKAKLERRAIRDGEITPACAQTCSSDAIRFGDLNDPAARVVEDHGNSRAYSMLAYLNVKPRTAYLARITNPNPALAGAEKPSAH